MRNYSDLIDRPGFLSWMSDRKDNLRPKLIRGIRQCGKSTLLRLFQNELQRTDTDRAQIQTIDLRDPHYRKWYLSPEMNPVEFFLPDRMNYVFFDGVRSETDIDRILTQIPQTNCDIYIAEAGSSGGLAQDLPEEIMQRCDVLSVLPLSFSEYCHGLREVREGSKKTVEENFRDYLSCGGFPGAVQYNLSEYVLRDYVASLYDTILLNDMIIPLKISNIQRLKRIGFFLLRNTGSRIITSRIVQILRENGEKTDRQTVDKYIQGFCSASVIHSIPRMNLRDGQILPNMPVYYLADTGIRQQLIAGSSDDTERLLRNIVCLELLRRGYTVFTGVIGEMAVDFVAERNGRREYYQVAVSLVDTGTKRQKLTPLGRIPDSYPQFVLTMDPEYMPADYEGVTRKNVLSWLLTPEPD